MIIIKDMVIDRTSNISKKNKEINKENTKTPNRRMPIIERDFRL